MIEAMSIQEVPAPGTTDFERSMLSEDKLFVVLAVVLVIWIGLIAFLVRTDRKIDRLEKRLNEQNAE